jgi:hypothetical protein
MIDLDKINLLSAADNRFILSSSNAIERTDKGLNETVGVLVVHVH